MPVDFRQAFLLKRWFNNQVVLNITYINYLNQYQNLKGQLPL
jgi:hypothetical protein